MFLRFRRYAYLKFDKWFFDGSDQSGQDHGSRGLSIL